MPQQLFLFDNEKKPDDKPEPSVPDPSASSLVDDEANKMETLAAINFDELPLVTNDDAKIEANPFAEVQQQQQEKIDTMLLMPYKKRGRKSFKDMDEESILTDVPTDEVLYQKQYYPTRVVASWFGITQSQLRAWEVEFDILQPKKNNKGDRYFRPEDVKNVKLIYHLIRKRKFTVEGAKQFLKENKKSLQTKMQLVESLHKFKQFLVELKAISG